MSRTILALLAFAWLILGCATEDDKRQWDEAMKDLRGDNMEMRNDFSTPDAMKPLRTNQGN
jgi:hypothetical protein